MTVTISPVPLRGTVTVPPSKSLSHRALIASRLAGGCPVENLADNDDISATRDCLNALHSGSGVYDCRESGSTLRFMIPIALALNGGGVFTGSPYLMKRPMEPYLNLFRQKGISIENTAGGLSLRGTLEPGNYSLPGNVSSQFVTGLLFTLPLLAGDSEVILETTLESKPYVDLTIQVLSAFGVTVSETPAGYSVSGGQAYHPCSYTVEGDESAAAFWYTANALGSQITCEGLNPYSIQGDAVIRNIISQEQRVIDVRECPDLVPILAVWCALRNGESRIVSAARLRGKECDRLAAITRELNRLGANITELPEELAIKGVPTLHGGVVQKYNDHRIPMSLAVAATCCTEPVTIEGAEDVGKSYPAFWADYQALGGVIE